ncbi:mn-dependent transcriptional regulator [Coprobacillus sp. CAG:698]|nr:mn-dependent transcriptional regulator [Coprobacillus sp. CAG:698]
MKIHESAEDYLERILVLKKKNGKVISIDIANSMNYSKPSISRAMKILRENEYITFEENGEINLTEKGLNIAQKIYERHVLLTNYFMALGVKEETARNDACKVEHDLSEETFNAIKAHVEKLDKKNN